jgi:hypothetical protein
MRIHAIPRTNTIVTRGNNIRALNSFEIVDGFGRLFFSVIGLGFHSFMLLIYPLWGVEPSLTFYLGVDSG